MQDLGEAAALGSALQRKWRAKKHNRFKPMGRFRLTKGLPERLPVWLKTERLATAEVLPAVLWRSRVRGRPLGRPGWCPKNAQGHGAGHAST
ncbi:hypothetical protein ACVWWO_005257 [Bradyrhizobium sp. F1.13.1]